LHDRNLLLSLAVGKNEPQEKPFGNDAEGRSAMIDFLWKFAEQHGSGRIVLVYEASGQGYGLYDLLTDHGIECYVASPAHLAKSAKHKKNKTDAKDDRELVRARLETAEAGTAVKLRIMALLKRQGCPLPPQRGWTKGFLSWLREGAALPEVVRPVLASLVARLEVLRQQRAQLEPRPRRLAGNPPSRRLARPTEHVPAACGLVE
jgi:transposase